jgi:hypothetical protein
MTTILTVINRGGLLRAATGAALILECAILGACGTTQPVPAAPVQTVTPIAATAPGLSVGTPIVRHSEGPIRLSAAAVWLPSASGFGPMRGSQKRNGRMVLTDNSVSWQYRSPGGVYRTAHHVAFADIRSVALAESGVDRLIVLQRQDFGYDAFGLMAPDEKALDPLATMQAYRKLLVLLHLVAPAPSDEKAF